MFGTITNKHLVTHCKTIVGCFGLRCYLKCWLKILKGDRFTFLEVAMKCDCNNREDS